MDDVLRHIKYQINAAPLRQWPFPHLLVDEILPPDYYDELVHALPHPHEFDYKEFGRGSSPERHRTIVRVKPEDYLLRDGDLEWFNGGGLTPILTDRFYLGDGPARTAGHLSIILNDGPGYAIGPHMDTGAKIVTMVMYTPTRSYLEQDVHRLGTSIYESKHEELGRTFERGVHYPFGLFDKIYTAPYRPNTALIFHSTKDSFHGVEPTNTNRMTMQYQVVDQNTVFAQSRGVA